MRRDVRFEIEVLANQITYIFFKLDELSREVSSLREEVQSIRRICLEER